MRTRAAILHATMALVLISVAHASPVHYWSKRFGDASTDQTSYSVAVDASGNVLIAGGFLSTANFGGGLLTSAGGTDVFLASFATDGSHLWSKRFGDVNPNQIAYAVATDGAGNVLVAGSHWGTVNFGGSPLTSLGGDDIFFAKLDSDGDHVWSKRYGDASTDQIARSIAIGPANVIVLAGWFLGTVNFGGSNLSSAGGVDIFVATFDAGGNHVWSQRFGAQGDQRLESVAVDGSGNVVLTGYYDGTVDFGGGQLVSVAGNDIFLAKLSSTGSHLWSQRFGNSSNDQWGESVATDASGNVIATGHFESTVNFGGSTLTSAGGDDIYLVKFDEDGGHTWSQRFGTTGNQTAKAVTIDALGGIALTGYYASTIDFGGGTLTNNGGVDIFVARFDPSGGHIWSAAFGGTTDQQAEAIAIDGAGKIALGGHFFSTVDFGGGNLTSAGGTDVFLTLLGDEPLNPVFITHFEARAAGAAVEVRWDVWADEALESYTLYRRDDDESYPRVVADGPAESGARTCIDGDVVAGRTYVYSLTVQTTAGESFQSPEATVRVPVPALQLGQNYPNPFVVRTEFEYTLDRPATVRVAVYDARGRRVVSLANGFQNSGRHRVAWDGRDDARRIVPSGVYFYQLEGAGAVAARRLLILR
ncbi:MAG: T9SS type A sorting domain-containing protein [Candidatus Latescibacteria bacterium]|nr:T9SS type A sorting domain-containing protein [Candidatus Latescibacterota bacterium]